MLFRSPRRATQGERDDRLAQQRMRGLQAPVVAGLREHVREHAQQFGGGMDMTDPAALVGVAQQDLRNRETDQFTVGEIGSVSAAGAWRDDVVIDQHVECGQEGVQVFRHTLIVDTLPPYLDTGPASHDLHRINHLDV